MRSIIVFSLISLFAITLFAQEDAKINTVKHGSDFPVFNEKNNLIYETFESGVWPPVGWTIIADSTPQTWDTASFDPHSGLYYAHCLYDETLSGVQNEFLISPTVDLRGVTSAVLTFYFQFSRYWGITPYDNYDLFVFASTDGGLTFPDTLWHELDTDTSAWTSFQWVMAQVDLAPYIGDSAFALAFVYYGYDGAEAALDDILLQTAGAIDESERQIIMYPNPADDFIFLMSKVNSYAIYSLDGKLLCSGILDAQGKISTSNLPNGTYIITTYNNSVTRGQKIVIQH